MQKQKKSLGDRIGDFLTWLVRFITYDIWRITEYDSPLKRFYIYITKTSILAIRGFQQESLQTRASALTYSTLLSIVPLLAVIVGVASGFGIRDAVGKALYDNFPALALELDKAFRFAENYLNMAQGGVFIGVGLAMLFFTVINLISSIEETFNDIWQIQKSRPWHSKIMDYLALFILLPVLMTLSSGISLFMTTIHSSVQGDFVLLTPVADFALSLLPFVITILFFTILYMVVPNTKVYFLNALIAGIIVGCAFQIFQSLYISGQIWVSKYNAIYGSFAALPLLLMWLQLSWLTCLFGAEIAYASQNVEKFSFERDTKTISRRYKDFLTLLIASLIVKRFQKGEKPYSANELSTSYKIPIRLTTQILYLLDQIGILSEVYDEDDQRIICYQPALDINQISVAFLLRRIDELGSESFKIDTQKTFRKEWEALLKTREDMFAPNSQILIKDL